MGKKMLHHLMVKVSDWPIAREFYSASLGELGYKLAADKETFGGFTAEDDTPQLYILQEENPKRLHFVLHAPTPEAVSAFYKTAQAHGGKAHGDPGYRAHYKEGGVGCFIIDPWDNNIEVVYDP
ncbi:hypothetical protein WJX73_003797 [Symbiochloris irregularis]|uniref:VOC domain-containing protein n=1 Tax=Symbiochloris irregularis TaxID=706552 RepID=A0AAW1Q3M0_9CHLO